MSDMVINILAHGYTDEDPVYVSWLDEVYYVADSNVNCFKLTTTAGGSTYVEWTMDMDDGYVREVDLTTATKTITGLSHLEGEDVYVVSNGINVGLYTVENDEVSVPYTIYSYYVGLPYTSTLIPMKIDLSGYGLAVKKKITEGTIQLYKTISGKWGNDVDNMHPFDYKNAEVFTDNTLFTGDITIPFDGGYDRSGDVIVQQTEPYPMTVLSLTLDVGAH